MTEANKIEIIIDGRNFTVVGGQNEEYVRSLAYHVDNKIRDLASKNERLSQTMSATLAALNIADELYKTKDQLDELENKAKDPLERYDSINKELEEVRETVQELRKNKKELEKLLKISKEENKKLMVDISNLETGSKSKDKKMTELNNHNKVLQEKNFQNQIELVEIRKEINEYLRLSDKKTSKFTKEGKQ